MKRWNWPRYALLALIVSAGPRVLADRILEGLIDYSESEALCYDETLQEIRVAGADTSGRTVVWSVDTLDQVSKTTLEEPTGAIGCSVVDMSLAGQIARLERREIERALRQAKGVKTDAARILGVSRKGLLDRLRRLGME